MTELFLILQSEFQRLADLPTDVGSAAAAGAKKGYRSLAQRARALKVDSGTLSRLLNGNARLSPKLADRFAARLRSDPAERRTLAERLLEAGKKRPLEDQQPSQYGDISAVKNFFERLSQEHCLLVVEYRDLPRAEPDAKYGNYARLAGQAIAKGLAFGMVLPFSDDSLTEPPSGLYHTRTIRSYLWDLKRKAIAAFNSIRDEARIALKELQKDSDVDKKALERRLVLYERSPGNSKSSVPADLFFSGIQSRVFYVEIRTEDILEKEVWEWVAARERDFFIQRDESSTPQNVIADQFFPIVKFWHDNEHARLPTSIGDLKNTIETYGTGLGANLPSEFWSVADAWNQALSPAPTATGQS